MRLFSRWNFIFSNGAEDTVNAVEATLQRQQQKLIRQVIQFADAGAATIIAAATYTVPWVGATSSRPRLFDLSVDKNVYLKITQNAVVKVVELYGTAKLPARFTATLAGTVTLIEIENREATDDCSAEWMYAEMDDITDADNFPVV